MTRYRPLEVSRIAFAGVPTILCAIIVMWLGGCGGGGDAEALPGVSHGGRTVDWRSVLWVNHRTIR